MGIETMRSPNFNERKPGIPLAYLIVHYTNMQSAQAALDRLCDPATEVSAHFLIDEDGTLYDLVDPAQRAWHAGKSFWRGITDLNSASIGIELVNPGEAFGYRPFPAPQIATLLDLMRTLCARYAIPPQNVLGHSDIAPGRRPDPGPLFPWKKLAEAGFGLWPTAPQNLGETEGSPQEASKLLSQIGYAPIPESLRAFQEHFVPHALTGEPNAETLGILRALVESLPAKL